VYLTNTTGLTLESGPVSVLEEGTFVGEALLDLMQPNETRFVEFSQEKSCDVWSSTTSDRRETYQATLMHGVMTLYQHRFYEKKYNIRNRGEKMLTMYLEHRFRKDCSLSETTPVDMKPTNKNPINFYIFRIPIKPHDTTVFTVIERGKDSQSYYISSVGPTTIVEWLQQKLINEKIKASLEEYVSVGSKLSTVRGHRSVLDHQLQECFREQERLNRNLGALNRDSKSELAHRETTIQQLALHDAKIKQLRDKQADDDKEIRTLEKQQENIIQRVTHSTTFSTKYDSAA